MHKPYRTLVKIKQPYSLCVATLIFVILLVRIAIANDVTGDFSNNYQDSTVDSNNQESSTTNNYNATGAGSAAPVMSAIAPTISILCQDPSVFRSMMLANTPCPINDSKTGKLLMGRAAIKKYRDSPALYIVGYASNIEFWDTLLRVGEEYTDEDIIEDTTPKLSLSDRFRSSKSRN